MTYLDLGYTNFLTINNPLNLSQGINSSNSDAIISSGVISYGQTSLQKLEPGQDVESGNYSSGVTGWKLFGDGNAEFVGITLSGGILKYSKTSFTDSTNSGYYIGPEGLYTGSAADASYLKYVIGTGALTYKGTVDGASTIGGRLASTLATAIDASGHFADSAINTATSTIVTPFTFGVSGALQIGTYVNGVSGDLKISPNGILARDDTGATTFSINGTTGVAVLNGLVVGTNVGIGTAVDSAGVTTIVGNTVTTGFVNALNVNAATVSASISITTPTITGGTITIGTGDAVFIAGANGIQLGDATFADAPFSVDMAGALKATSATITGALTTGAGSSIGGSYLTGAISAWNITADKLRSGTTDANSNIILDPTNSIVRLGPTTGNYITLDGANQNIESNNFVNGVSGFRISPTLIEAENIIARGTLRGSTFANDVISAVGGQLMVTNADSLASDMTASDTSTLTIKGDTSFAINDLLQIKGLSTTGIDTEWLKVTALNSGKNDGTVSGGVTISDNAMVFDGVDGSKVEIDNLLTTFAQTGTYSVSLWVYINSTGTNRNVWNFNGGSSNRHNLNFNGTSIGFQRYNGSSYSGIKATSTVDVGSWFHIVCINNGGTMSLFKNTVSIGASGHEYLASAIGNKLVLGYPNNGTNGSGAINGSIAVLQVYKKALTETEIKEIYNAGKDADSPILSGLIAQYSGRRYIGTESSPTSIIDTSPPSYSVTRDLAGLFSANANPIWKAGTPVVKQGAWSSTSGNAYDPATLTGGTDVVLQNFIDLANGDNNGAFKLTVDETEYDNVTIDLSAEEDTASLKITTTASTDDSYRLLYGSCGQTLDVSSILKITRITAPGTNTGNATVLGCSVYNSVGGTLIGSKGLSGYGNSFDFTFDTAIDVSGLDSVYIKLESNYDKVYTHTNSTNPYSGGSFYTWNNIEVSGTDMLISLYGKELKVKTDAEDYIATLLQTAIRAKTSSTQTVVWDTDHFLITGVEPDYHISITAPSTDFVSVETRPAGDTDKSWLGACISKDGKTIYANVNNDVYISTDSGANWSSIKPTTTTYFQNALMSDNGSIQYILNYGYLGKNFYRRMNGSWADIAQMYNNVVCSANGKYIFGNSPSNNQTCYSNDYGATWSSIINKTATSLDISDDGSVMAHVGYYVGSGNDRNIIISRNYGSTWSVLYNGYWEHEVKLSGDGTMALVRAAGVLQLTKDDGTTWKQLKTDSTGKIFFSKYNDRIYSGNYYTEDEGETWVQLTPGYFLNESETGKRFLTVNNSRLYLNTKYEDISLSGYLDLADGVSKQGGYGSGGWLRLIGEGTNSPYYSVFQRLSGAYDDYVETCRLGNLNGILGYSDNLYGIAIGDSDSYMTYDIENGLNIGGSVGNVPAIFTGTAAPATTPTKIGDMFVDTTNHKIYVSDGTTNSSNWRVLN
jgi:hypothetical protein